MILAPHQLVAARWASTLLDEGTAVVLDTETTGLGSGAEVVQVGLVDLAGTPLLDTLVRPCLPIPPEATAIHGITNDQVAGAPGFAEVASLMLEQLLAREVVIFNANYDLRVLQTSLRLTGQAVSTWVPPGSPLLFGARQYTCAMLWYAQFVGQPSAKGRGWRWQPLPGGDHTALGDAQATLALIRRMAAGEFGGIQ